MVWAWAGLLAIAIFFLDSIREAHTGPKQGNLSNSSPSVGPTLLEQPGVPWYIRSGQWRADMRSLVAVLRYLAQPESLGQTNPMPAKADNV